MWSNKQTPDDDSWEVRAFEEDTTGNLLGCTWPPRSYTCTFCRREFRSAQALGGHMNVHRRDRARLHELPPPVLHSPAAASTQVLPSAAVFIPTSRQEFVVGNGNGSGLCLVYPLLNPNSNSTILIPSPTAVDNFPSHPPLLPISHFFKCEPNHDTAANSVVSSLCHSSNTDAISPSNSDENCNDLIIKDENADVKDNAAAAAIEEELDLELRLGRRTPPPGDD